ncbi:MAG: hypothetical protein BWX99_02182 [Deltaproteobacteria bacterium ADurb.Bin151]|nr:MAG: hypothetical protein BWX99_02182 [Deltaproteobacteria bacterium ADurb.Bin151]
MLYSGMRFAFIIEATDAANLRLDVKIRKNKGFNLLELIIVMAILGIVASIASFSWRQYVPKINLRSAARQVSADVSKYRAKAMGEGRAYTMSFSGTGYNVTAPAKAGNTDLPAFNLNATPVAEVNSKDRKITAAACAGGGSDLTMSQRGLSNGCTVTLQNSRGAEATITVDMRGRTTVAFDWK